MVHPEDAPTQGIWATQRWDEVIDLGLAGQESYRRWNGSLRCPVTTAPKLEKREFDEIRAMLGGGLGRLVDKHGLDWWDLIALEFHSQFEQLMRLRKLSERFTGSDGIFVSRPGFESQVLPVLLGRPVATFAQRNVLGKKISRYTKVVANLSAAQMLQIAGDKYDPGYRIRRFVAPDRKASRRPVVVLPSSYVNVSRTELQYAAMLPDSDFLLVATRQSGWIANTPRNVAVAKLASYANGVLDRDEFEILLRAWSQLRTDLGDLSSFDATLAAGVLNGLPKMLRDGILIRNAWLQLFAREPVRAVLCADDANMATRIPLLIAANRGLPAISCHHGALDGRYRMRPKHDGLFLAKSRMEQDYLLTVCGSPRSVVETGGALQNGQARHGREGHDIVFFSEPYENVGGRTAEFYRDVLPRLADVAISTACKLAIKLHPAESLRDRTSLAKGVLSEAQAKTMQIVTGPLTEELLANTWFGVSVLSTAAMDCSMRGVPAFLCAWLDYSSYGQLEQMTKFGAGMRLDSPEEIPLIPARLDRLSGPAVHALWEPIEAERLEELFAGVQQKIAAAV